MIGRTTQKTRKDPVFLRGVTVRVTSADTETRIEATLRRIGEVAGNLEVDDLLAEISDLRTTALRLDDARLEIHGR